MVGHRPLEASILVRVQVPQLSFEFMRSSLGRRLGQQPTGEVNGRTSPSGGEYLGSLGHSPMGEPSPSPAALKISKIFNGVK